MTKYKYERKNEKDSGRSSKMTPSCTWPIVITPSELARHFGLGEREGWTELPSNPSPVSREFFVFFIRCVRNSRKRSVSG